MVMKMLMEPNDTGSDFSGFLADMARNNVDATKEIITNYLAATKKTSATAAATKSLTDLRKFLQSDDSLKS